MIGVDLAKPGSEETVVVFKHEEDFKALRMAQKWCEENGISYGSTDRTMTIGLLYGDFAIAKWINLTPKERRDCHGTMRGDFRHGPVTVRIRPRP